MTVLSTQSPGKSTPVKVHLKRQSPSGLSSPSSGAKRSRQVETTIQSIVLKRPKKTVGEPWPLGDLRAFDAPYAIETGINYGPMLRDVLRERGWRYSTKPCHGTNAPTIHDDDPTPTFFVKEFEAMLRGETPEKLFGKRGSVEDGYQLQLRTLPKHALWMMTRMPYRVPGTCGDASREREDFVKIVVAHGDKLLHNAKAGNHRMAKFPGTETLLFKTHLTEAFQDKSWYPLTYILPKDKASLLKDIHARGNSKSNLWIGKPRNDYGGKGIRVYKGTDPELVKAVQASDKEPRSLIQWYLPDPLLIGGYKFHMRIHLVITNLSPLEAYVQENGQCLFATKPYTLASNTLGAAFDPPVHVTNMGLNAKPENKENYFKKKPVIGRGQQIRVQQLVSYLQDTVPDFSKQNLWQQIINISADTASYIGQGVLRNNPGKIVKDRHFELFGMDLMLDKDMKVWMCEVNTDPGLGYPDEEVLGSPNPDYQKELHACKDTFHDIFALLGLDSAKEQTKGSLRHWFELDFSDSKTSKTA